MKNTIYYNSYRDPKNRIVPIYYNSTTFNNRKYSIAIITNPVGYKSEIFDMYFTKRFQFVRLFESHHIYSETDQNAVQ